MSFELKITGEDIVFKNLEKAAIKTIANAVKATEYTAAEMEIYAHQTAPWTDRTGLARKRLYAQMDNTFPDLSIVIGHRMEYGIYLELSNLGKYRVIVPTVNKYRSIWKNRLGSILEA
jgi:hypothetical protein